MANLPENNHLHIVGLLKFKQIWTQSSKLQSTGSIQETV